MSSVETQSQDEIDFCPSCGKEDVIHEVTGWCYPCSGVAPPLYCEQCNRPIKENNGKLCDSCKYMRWLERNANKIEQIMATFELSAGKAKRAVRANNRPICLCCGNPIKGGQRGKNYFCTKTKACKTGRNSYHYYTFRGYKDALERAMVAATRERLIHEAASKNNRAA